MRIARMIVYAALLAVLAITATQTLAQTTQPTPAPESAQQAAPPSFETAVVTDTKSVDVTAIRASKQRLYCGLAGGGILTFDKATKTANSLTPTPTLGPAKAIAVGGGTVWWVAGKSGTLLSYSVAANKVTIFNLPEATAIERLEYWNGLLAMIGSRGVSFLDPKTHSTLAAKDIFPEDVAAVLDQSAIYLSESGDGWSAAAVRQVPNGTEIDAYKRVKSGGWERRLQWYTKSAVSGVAIDTSRVVLLSPDLILDFSLASEMPVPKAIPLSLNGVNMAKLGCVILNGSDLWFTQNGTVFRADLTNQSVESYLPWNESGFNPKTLCGDSQVCWAAGKGGFRQVESGESRSFVVAELDPQSEIPADDCGQKLAKLVEQWQGTPYKFGGSCKAGTDCSGFVLAIYAELGIKLPHGSAYLKTHKAGTVIRDRLKYGDVLVEPGHASLYIGNGKTAETLTGVGVSKGTIWRKRGVTVRRFLSGS